MSGKGVSRIFQFMQWKIGGKLMANGNQGKLELATGDVYDGQWRDNQFQGSGTYVWSDGSAFTGEWESNALNGPGRFIDSHGQTWQGSVYQTTPATLLPELAQ